MTTLTSTAFLDFCILCGTDASPRIPGIGPKRAFKLISEHGSIEAILAINKYRDKIDDLESFMSMVKNAREVFGTAPPIPEGLTLEQGEYDEAEVEEWLRDTHGVMFLDQEQVSEMAEIGLEQEWPVGDSQSVQVEDWDESWDRPVLDDKRAESIPS
jgi:flap endonuclease-1